MPTTLVRPKPHKAISLRISLVAFGLIFFATTDLWALATIQYPTPYQDITSEADYFTAMGELFDYPLGVIELRDSEGNLIQPLSLFTDHLYLQAWVATYPPLEPGIYYLYVEDIYGNGDLVEGIYVGP